MNAIEFRESVREQAPPQGFAAPLAALWWDAKGDWARAHAMVDELETKEGMAVHAYLHRKEGDASNAGYWYSRAGRTAASRPLADEWLEIAKALLEA